MKFLFCINILFALLNAIASDADFFNNMSPEERRSFFGTDDGSIPAYEIVQMALPSRSKRSADDPVNITLNAFGSFVTTSLYAVDDKDLISREITGVYNAEYSPESYEDIRYTPRPHVMMEIGEIEFYHNVEDGSAITRFRDASGDEIIMGILKHNYTVRTVPKKFAYAFVDISHKHVVNERSVDSIKDQDEKRLTIAVFKDDGILKKFVRRQAHGTNEALEDNPLHRARRQSTTSSLVPDVVYPKLLVIPDASLVKRYENLDDFLKHLIAQLHAVDTLFRKLKDPEVHLRIDGIIIPSDNAAAPYFGHTDFPRVLNSYRAITLARMYFQREIRRFPRTRWDSIVLLTGNTLGTYDRETGELLRLINGRSSLGKGCEGDALISTFTEDIGSVITLAHELGHMFGMHHDGDSVAGAPQQCNFADAYVMGGFGSDRKLEWSNCSRANIRDYFRSGEGNCTYVRFDGVPDDKRNKPGAWLPVDGQCDNLYKDSVKFCKHKNSSCVKYGCKINGECQWVRHPPTDGSFPHDAEALQACLNQ